MKNENRYLLVSVTLLVALAFVLFGCVFANAAAKSGQERYDEKKDKNVCEAGSVFDLLTPKVVEFYEKEIAGEKVLSQKSDAQLASIAKRYDITVQKARAVIVLYDFANRTGGGADFQPADAGGGPRRTRSQNRTGCDSDLYAGKRRDSVCGTAGL